MLLAWPAFAMTAGTRSGRSWLCAQLGAAARSVGPHHGEAYRVQVRYACEDLTLLRRRLRTFKGDIEKVPRGRLPTIALVAATRKLLIAVYHVSKDRRPFIAAPVVAPADTSGRSPSDDGQSPTLDRKPPVATKKSRIAQPG